MCFKTKHLARAWKTTGCRLFCRVSSPQTLFQFSRRSNFCKDHRDKTEVQDPLVVEDLISYKLNNRRKLARLIIQYRNIFFLSIYTV